MKANSLKADNYRRAESTATCCAVCEHFLDNGPNRRLCRIHSLGLASAYSGSVLPTVTHHMVCDKFQMKGLKPCPFCGGPADIGTYSIDGYTTAWTGTCKDDQCNGYCIADYFRSAHSLREAVAAWNRRAGEGGK